MSLHQGAQSVADFTVDFRDTGSRLGAPEHMQQGHISLTLEEQGYLCLYRQISVCTMVRLAILSPAVQ